MVPIIALIDLSMALAKACESFLSRWLSVRSPNPSSGKAFALIDQKSCLFFFCCDVF